MKMEKSSNGVRTVSAIALEMRQAIISLAGERAVYDSRERWLARAARTAGISQRAAKTLFYAEQDNPGSAVVEKVRAAVSRKKVSDDDAMAVELARSERREILSRLERIETALGLSDSDFHRNQIDALRAIRSKIDRPLDRG